ncbi:MAG: MFS transporter, partial [Gammaproteobacteria bacterium]|nr:MFS transporter [Gammaproteobacteria bacterium]
GIAILMLTVIRAGRQLLIPLWGKALGLSTSDIGFLMGLASAVDMCLFPVAGYLMDHWGRRYAAIACIGILSLGLLMVPFTTSFGSLLLAATLAAAGNGLGSGINMTMGSDFAPAKERGEFLGVWRLLSDIGSFAGPLLMGWIANTMMLSAAFFATSAMGTVGVLIVLLLVKETLEKGNPQEDRL